jgi:hypothetical protein
MFGKFSPFFAKHWQKRAKARLVPGWDYRLLKAVFCGTCEGA